MYISNLDGLIEDLRVLLENSKHVHLFYDLNPLGLNRFLLILSWNLLTLFENFC